MAEKPRATQMRAPQEVEPSNRVPLAPAADHSTWNFPMVYLLLGLMAMAALIAVAMIILLCSFRRPNLRGKGDVEEARERELEPRVVVIMAGDDKPTFLAQPHVLRAPPCVSQV